LIALADTFNNESMIDRPVFAVRGDSLVGLAVLPILCSFHVRELRNDDSLNRIAFKDFVLSKATSTSMGRPFIVAWIPVQYFRALFDRWFSFS
jgi:hypothetical protein